jgi:acetaldehyde/propanal dehydrogenase
MEPEKVVEEYKKEEQVIPEGDVVKSSLPKAFDEVVEFLTDKVAERVKQDMNEGTQQNGFESVNKASETMANMGGAKKGKAIIIINPADPPLIMRDTVHCLTEGVPDQAKITASVHEMIKEVQKYVPGYKLVNGPVFDGNRVSVFLEVEGLGDYLPKYAGNLDIMTAAAARTAEMFAEEIIAGKLTLQAA